MRIECKLCKRIVEYDDIIRIIFNLRKEQIEEERYVCKECTKEIIRLIDGRPENMELIVGKQLKRKGDKQYGKNGM